MFSTIKIATMTLLISLSGYHSFAQTEGTSEKKTKISVEIDPATFAFGGYSAHLRLKPANWDHIQLGAGIYAMNFPDLFVGLNDNNKDKGWDVRLNLGVGLFGEYFFKEVNKGWFLGAQASMQEYRIENSNAEGQSTFTNGLIMAYGGYSLQPFSFPLYFKPWAGVGYTDKISGKNTVGDLTYDISPISMFATLHIGYTF
jgi:hypothetical protein